MFLTFLRVNETQFKEGKGELNLIDGTNLCFSSIYHFSI
ncbi:MAG: hypothetical protein ACJA17_000101 [Polaribacter sp.]|jgi:hypothetical protein